MQTFDVKDGYMLCRYCWQAVREAHGEEARQLAEQVGEFYSTVRYGTLYAVPQEETVRATFMGVAGKLRLTISMTGCIQTPQRGWADFYPDSPLELVGVIYAPCPAGKKNCEIHPEACPHCPGKHIVEPGQFVRIFSW